MTISTSLNILSWLFAAQTLFCLWYGLQIGWLQKRVRYLSDAYHRLRVQVETGKPPLPKIMPPPEHGNN